MSVGAVNLIYQFWVHTRHVPELGWLEYVFITPSNHRVHHAQNDCYVDKNYGGVFIVWDRLFGTYQPELADTPCIYGIRGPLLSWSPLRALTHIYVDMLNDIRQAASWGERCQVLIAKTGWQPGSIPEAARRQKNDLSQFHVYDPAVASARRVLRWPSNPGCHPVAPLGPASGTERDSGVVNFYTAIVDRSRYCLVA